MTRLPSPLTPERHFTDPYTDTFTDQPRPGIRYLAATSSSLIGAHPDIHVMIGPRQSGLRPLREGRAFGVDNDAFHRRFEPEKFERHLRRLLPFAAHCLFVAMPDFRDDPDSTAALFRHYAPGFAAEYPFRMALVAQTGATPHDLAGAGALFLAGNDEWRMGPAGDDLILAAQQEYGIPVHVGRVNGKGRLLHFAQRGVESVDGTYLSFRGLERGLSDIAGWLDAAARIRTGTGPDTAPGSPQRQTGLNDHPALTFARPA